MSALDRSLPSPDGSRVARLVDVGEIPFGPPYFSLWIDALSFDDRIFGDSIRWSDDSRMLAIEEWLTTDRQLGPLTLLTVIDVSRKKQCAIARADKGFIAIHSFAGGIVSFQERYYGQNAEIDRQRQLPLAGQWTGLDAPLTIHEEPK